MRQAFKDLLGSTLDIVVIAVVGATLGIAWRPAQAGEAMEMDVRTVLTGEPCKLPLVMTPEKRALLRGGYVMLNGSPLHLICWTLGRGTLITVSENGDLREWPAEAFRSVVAH